MTIVNSTTKVCFIGNRKTSKTTIAKALLKKSHDNIPTEKAEVYTYTSPSKHVYEIWDCPGDEDYRDLHDDYYVGCDLFIIFERDAFGHIDDIIFDEWQKNVLKISPDAIIHAINNATIEDIEEILI